MTLIQNFMCELVDQRQKPLHIIPIPMIDDSDSDDENYYSESYEDSDQSSDLIKPFLQSEYSELDIQRITACILSDLIHKRYPSAIKMIIDIIDCRFWYEVEGGRIKNATSIDSPELFLKMFFDHPKKNHIIIFHCELSQTRGPKMAHIFREYDRLQNTYPKLFYPNVFILDGGFKEFFKQFPEDCEGGYIKMYSEPYKSNGLLAQAKNHFDSELSKFQEKMKKLKTSSSEIDLQVAPRKGFGTPVRSKSLSIFRSPFHCK